MDSLIFFKISPLNFPRKSNFRVIISDMCCNLRRKKQIFSYATSPIGLDNKLALSQNSQHSTAQHSTAQHSTALAKQAQLATSTSYNSARNNFSGYMHFKSDITTFSHRKTAHDAGQIKPCSWAFYFKHFRRHLCRNFQKFSQ